MLSFKIGKSNFLRNCLPVFTAAALFGAVRSHGADSSATRDPDQDFAFLEFEPYPDFQSVTQPNAGGSQMGRIAGQLAFPGGHVAGHELFGVFKSTLIRRDIAHADTILDGGLLQRYWLSGGIVLLDRPDQNAEFMVGGGLNSDMADIGLMDFNSEWIYAHNFILSPVFSFGLGADLQQYLHKVAFYPLIFIDWRLNDKTHVKWDADYAELRRFLGNSLALTAGMRFNLEFFALQHDATYEYKSLGLETGLQYALGHNWYARLKYKELVWGRESVGLPDGQVFRERIVGGRSLRLNFAYGI
jgi:hypothetical protein